MIKTKSKTFFVYGNDRNIVNLSSIVCGYSTSGGCLVINTRSAWDGGTFIEIQLTRKETLRFKEFIHKYGYDKKTKNSKAVFWFFNDGHSFINVLEITRINGYRVYFDKNDYSDDLSRYDIKELKMFLEKNNML